MILDDKDISIMRIHNLLGHPSYDLGTLCSAGEPYINKWSKYKPVEHNCFGSGVQYYPDDWYRGSERDCGISYPVFHSARDFMDNIMTNHKFTYQPPTGGLSSPYRLGDFRNYDTDALPPLWGEDYSDLTLSMATSEYFQFQVSINDDETPHISIEDLYKRWVGNDIYYGVAFEDENNSAKRMWKTTDTPYDPTDVNTQTEIIVELPTYLFENNHSYNVYHFLTNRQGFRPDDGGGTGNFVPIPDTNYNQVIHIVNTKLKIEFDYITYDSTRSSFKFKLSFNNKTGAVKYLKSSKAMFLYDSSEGTGERGERTVDLGTIEVPKGISLSQEFTSPNNTLPDFKKGRQCWLVFTGDYGVKYAQTQIPEDAGMEQVQLRSIYK